MEFPLSAKLKDKLTGFTGVATGRCESLDGCIQYLLTPQAKEGEKFPEGTYIDYQRLEIVEDPIIDVPMHVFKFDLGDRVRDRVTGHEGIAVVNIAFINGCVRYGVAGKKQKKSEKVPDEVYFASEQLELIKAQELVVDSTDTGCDIDPKPINTI